MSKKSKLVELEFKNVQRRLKDCPDLKYTVFNLPVFEARVELTEQLLEKIKETYPQLSVVLVSASPKAAHFLCYLVDSSSLSAKALAEQISNSNWELKDSSSEAGSESVSLICGVLKESEDYFPEKLADEIVNQSISFLRSKGLIPSPNEEEDDYLDPTEYGLGEW